MFSEDFIEFENVFWKKGFYKSVKKFILKALEIDEKKFFSLKIESIVIESERHSQTKAKLAFFYLRSNENLIQIQEHIFNQIIKLDIGILDKIQ